MSPENHLSFTKLGIYVPILRANVKRDESMMPRAEGKADVGVSEVVASGNKILLFSHKKFTHT